MFFVNSQIFVEVGTSFYCCYPSVSYDRFEKCMAHPFQLPTSMKIKIDRELGKQSSKSRLF